MQNTDGDNQKRVITASEGADLIAKRYLEYQASRIPEKGIDIEEENEEVEHNEEEESIYQCMNCGHDIFVVEVYYDVNDTRHEVLECQCGKSDLAAEKTFDVTESIKEWGHLGNDHRYSTEKIEVLESTEELIEEKVYCDDCYNDEELADAWESDEQKDSDCEDENGDKEFFVICDKCGHEIEFGWSHFPTDEGGGRIWPCEIKKVLEFNPKKSVPDPRYAEFWKKRNWTRE